MRKEPGLLLGHQARFSAGEGEDRLVFTSLHFSHPYLPGSLAHVWLKSSFRAGFDILH